jgi:hypothetical protein
MPRRHRPRKHRMPQQTGGPREFRRHQITNLRCGEVIAERRPKVIGAFCRTRTVLRARRRAAPAPRAKLA